jgi:hypothetical protein
MVAIEGQELSHQTAERSSNYSNYLLLVLGEPEASRVWTELEAKGKTKVSIFLWPLGLSARNKMRFNGTRTCLVWLGLRATQLQLHGATEARDSRAERGINTTDEI